MKHTGTGAERAEDERREEGPPTQAMPAVEDSPPERSFRPPAARPPVPPGYSRSGGPTFRVGAPEPAGTPRPPWERGGSKPSVPPPWERLRGAASPAPATRPWERTESRPAGSPMRPVPQPRPSERAPDRPRSWERAEPAPSAGTATPARARTDTVQDAPLKPVVPGPPTEHIRPAEPPAIPTRVEQPVRPERPARPARPAPELAREDRRPIEVRRLRRGRLAIRKISPWSALRFSLVFFFCMLLIALLSTAIIFAAMKAFGVIANIEEFIAELGISDDPINGGTIFRWLFLIGLAGTVVGSVITMFMAFLYNLIADVVGGIELLVTERE